MEFHQQRRNDFSEAASDFTKTVKSSLSFPFNESKIPAMRFAFAAAEPVFFGSASAVRLAAMAGSGLRFSLQV